MSHLIRRRGESVGDLRPIKGGKGGERHGRPDVSRDTPKSMVLKRV